MLEWLKDWLKDWLNNICLNNFFIFLTGEQYICRHVTLLHDANPIKDKFLKIFSCASCQNAMQVSPFKRLNGASPIFGERPFKRLNGETCMTF